LSDEDAQGIAETLALRLGLTELLDLAPRVRALTIVPDDALHGFPFAALRIGGRYLVERFAVSIAHEPFSRSAPLKGGGGMCVVAVDDEMPGWGALPGTQAQLDDVRAFAARRGLSMDEMRNEPVATADLLRRMSAAAMLHISCHGVFSPDRPEETGLVLRGPDREPRLVTLSELGAAALAGVEHVTLLSCWGADNYILPGRWIVSFPEVLRRAGARSVLASLWEIDDTRVTSILRRFYEKSETLPRDEALRAVQLACLAERENRDPMWWSGFQLYGDAQRMVW
jgi:CHAT domain-containing protein